MDLREERLSPILGAIIRELYPITRSITGDGVRATLDVLGRRIDLRHVEVPTGTPVFDWTVPREWRFRDAYLKNGRGERIVDRADATICMCSAISAPAAVSGPLEAILPYLLTDPARPQVVPYRTSYYSERAALCISHAQLEELQRLPLDTYELVIDTEFFDGSLTYGECVIPGATEDEILLTTHVCHPSLANDNCAGLALLATLVEALAEEPLRHTIRALFIPGTIGSITWLATHEATLGRIRAGLVLNNIGDDAPFTYKRSRRGSAPIDRVAPRILRGFDSSGAGWWTSSHMATTSGNSALLASIFPSAGSRGAPTATRRITRPPTISTLSSRSTWPARCSPFEPWCRHSTRSVATETWRARASHSWVGAASTRQ